MTIYSIIFYLLAILILVTTALAVTRRDLVHAVIYLIFSFFGINDDLQNTQQRRAQQIKKHGTAEK